MSANDSFPELHPRKHNSRNVFDETSASHPNPALSPHERSRGEVVTV